MRKLKLMMLVVLALTLALGLGVGCGKKTVPSPDQLSAEEQARLAAERERRMREAQLREGQAGSEGALTGTEAQMREVFENQDVHFDYDSYDLSPEAKQILNEKAAYLKSHSDLLCIVEGHCDERGSNAYNMALGEKRARAAAAYLEAMGISQTRLETVSYGEERPLVPGQTEEAYAANRRAHFVVK
ncbi:MAG: peptidoglycan-associated lipoprotein Pal [Deltaproteobacteria bacterium]|nr:peptidoglycan-associated lipoprotein Pal [Deltaproteobacteria bacterium]